MSMLSLTAGPQLVNTAGAYLPVLRSTGWVVLEFPGQEETWLRYPG
jgi:hypothetical protein